MPFVFANVLQPLIDVLDAMLVFFHDHALGGSWGLSIILLTIVVRAALVPLTLKQMKSMQSLQRLAPEIKVMQGKYKDDKQRLNQEMMKFYKENQVNPLGSCLPLVFQFPFFIGLYYTLRKDLKLDICGDAIPAAVKHSAKALQSARCDQYAPHSAKFLFIPDITAKATGTVLVVLIVLYVGSQLASSLVTPVTDKNQRRLMLFLPLFFITIIFRFPAGLLVYWITTNLWTVGQQYVVRRTMGPLIPATAGAPPAGARAAVDEGGGKEGGGKAARETKAGRDGKGSGPVPPPAKVPPPSARKKKKRSGRRR